MKTKIIKKIIISIILVLIVTILISTTIIILSNDESKYMKEFGISYEEINTNEGYKETEEIDENNNKKVEYKNEIVNLSNENVVIAESTENIPIQSSEEQKETKKFITENVKVTDRSGIVTSTEKSSKVQKQDTSNKSTSSQTTSKNDVKSNTKVIQKESASKSESSSQNTTKTNKTTNTEKKEEVSKSVGNNTVIKNNTIKQESNTVKREEKTNLEIDSGTYVISDAKAMLPMLNEARRKLGAPALSWDSNLESLCKTRSKELILDFSHNRPSGARAENIAYGITTTNSMYTAWMDSPPHKKNIINKKYTKVGIAKYVYKGVSYWTMLLA